MTMIEIESAEGKPPLGCWLRKERERLHVSLQDIANLFLCPTSDILEIEEYNRVVPPGWFPALRQLGIELCPPKFNVSGPPYMSADLRRDLQFLRQGNRLSHLIQLAKALGVSEKLVSEIVASDAVIVPSEWYWKLAEFGALVSGQVVAALVVAQREALVGGHGKAKKSQRVCLSCKKPIPAGLRKNAIYCGNSACRAREYRRRMAAAEQAQNSGGSADGVRPSHQSGVSEQPSLSITYSKETGLRISVSKDALAEVVGFLVQHANVILPGILTMKPDTTPGK